MASVTGRINEVKQPRGGYVNLGDFEKIVFDDGKELSTDENIHASLIGIAVDYLTRLLTGEAPLDAFNISLSGAERAEEYGYENANKQAKLLLKKIKGLDDASIINACKLVTFDLWKRKPRMARISKKFDRINPNKQTINNIRIMVKRNISFLKKYGPIVKSGFTFEPKKFCDIDSADEKKNAKAQKAYADMIILRKGTFGGYTPTVSSGDGDLVTSDTMWEIKTSRRKPTSKHILQLLMYWIMGKHSKQDIFKPISKLGFYNPRLNMAWIIKASSIDRGIIKIIEKEIIRY